MADVPPPAAHAKRPRAAAEMHGTADGGWDGDDGSVMGTRLWVGGQLVRPSASTADL